MYKNLKIQERLKKCFTVVALLASIAGVIGAIMMLSLIHISEPTRRS